MQIAGILTVTTFESCFVAVAVSVVIDRQMDSCKSGGAELIELHTNVAQRRQRVERSPILESCHFFPYDEHSLALGRLDSPLVEYAETCASFALDRMHDLLEGAENDVRNLKLMQRLVSETGWTPTVNEKLKEHLSSPDAVSLRTLEKIFAVAHDDAFAQNVNSIVSASWADIVSTDLLFGFARSDRCFKNCLDIVLENIPVHSGDDHIQVVECDAGTGLAYPHAMHQLSLYPGVSIRYIAIDPDPAWSIDPELAKKYGIDTVGWSMEGTKPVPGLASGADLVILANVLHKHDNISKALSASKSLVSDNGFLLIVEPTSNFAIPWSFFALSQDVTQMSDIGSRTCGPFCDERTWTTLLTDAGLTPVAQKSDGVLNTVFLCRKLSSTSPEQVPKIIDVDEPSFGWLEDVKSVMTEERSGSNANCSVWLRAKKADSGLVGMLKCLRREPNGDRLR